MNTSLPLPVLPSPLRWPAGTCAARVPLCSLFSYPRRASIAEADFPHVNRLMPRLGVGGLARALGTTTPTLDKWVCGRGVRPDLAAALAERFLWLLHHENDRRGRCACRLCAPTPQERFHDRIWRPRPGDPGAVAVGHLLGCRGSVRREEACA